MNGELRFCLSLVVGVGLLFLVGCGEQSTRQQANSGWERTDPSEFSSEMKVLFDRAERSRKVLGKTLFERLTEVMSTKGPRGAIDVCNVEAQGITRQVGEQFDVRIGRTSFKLRNPENTPPDWARERGLVEKRVDEQVVLKNGEGRLAVFTPIHLKKKCATCHGPEEALSEGVRAELEKRYPEDEATGFQPGDLRGWFWVDVRRDSR